MKINVHAGHNPDGMVAHGAVGYLKESSENRLVATEIIRQLRKLGHTVHDCTVNNGVSQSDVLNKIVRKCNRNQVDLDVSIHFNAFQTEAVANGMTKGTEVLVYSKGGVAEKYAEQITLEIARLGYRNRGVKVNQGLYVLNGTKAPAILVECCFVDDLDDVALYDYRKMATAIVKGIVGETAEEVNVSDDTLYRVQVGAYGVKDNADAMMGKLKEAGYDAFITKA